MKTITKPKTFEVTFTKHLLIIDQNNQILIEINAQPFSIGVNLKTKTNNNPYSERNISGSYNYYNNLIEKIKIIAESNNNIIKETKATFNTIFPKTEITLLWLN